MNLGWRCKTRCLLIYVGNNLEMFVMQGEKVDESLEWILVLKMKLVEGVIMICGSAKIGGMMNRGDRHDRRAKDYVRNRVDRKMDNIKMTIYSFKGMNDLKAYLERKKKHRAYI